MQSKRWLSYVSKEYTQTGRMIHVDLLLFTDESKNITPKEELEEEKHNKMVVDSESPNEESQSENGRNMNTF